jgi:hypothetical protein
MLVTTGVADVTLAGVLQQLPLLTVRLPATARQPQACMHSATVVRHCIMRCMRGTTHVPWCL